MQVLTTQDPLIQAIQFPCQSPSHVASCSLAGVKDVSGLGAGDSALIPQFLEAGILQNNWPYLLHLDNASVIWKMPIASSYITIFLRIQTCLSVAVKHRRLPEASEADRFFENLLPGGEIEYQQWYHMPASCQKKFNGADP